MFEWRNRYLCHQAPRGAPRTRQPEKQDKHQLQAHSQHSAITTPKSVPRARVTPHNMDKGSPENKFKATKMPEQKKPPQHRGIRANSHPKPGPEATARAVEETNPPPQRQTTEAEEKPNMHMYTRPPAPKWARDTCAPIQCTPSTKHPERTYVCPPDACICAPLTHILYICAPAEQAYIYRYKLQNTHIYAHKTRPRLRTKHAHARAPVNCAPHWRATPIGRKGSRPESKEKSKEEWWATARYCTDIEKYSKYTEQPANYDKKLHTGNAMYCSNICNHLLY